MELKALRHLEASGRLPRPRPGPRLDFADRLRRRAAAWGVAVIAEYKRASPSQGDIAPDISPGEAALAYVKGGAAAMSILTEKSRFRGRLGFIAQAWDGGAELFDLPILRKDFIFDPLQVRATAAGPAAALLLIVKLTPEAALLRELRLTAESFGLQAVVEVLDEGDLELARASGAAIIQVNARDFTDLSVDLDRALNLARRHAAAAGELWIAASGFSRPEELPAAGQAGFTAILAGTALMRGGRLDEALTRLTSALKKGEPAAGHVPA
ncbi:MAG: indole-3-glycerol-phosphate synthase [Candidatus Adiutrix sp.]|nr:indole-3-glycerol-phosphate synthase [Candidatus Adiutrix sp.]